MKEIERIRMLRGERRYTNVVLCGAYDQAIDDVIQMLEDRQMNNSEVRERISKAKDVKEIDHILKDTWCKSDADKIVYLSQLFGEELISGDDRHEKYLNLVSMILKKGDKVG